MVSIARFRSLATRATGWPLVSATGSVFAVLFAYHDLVNEPYPLDHVYGAYVLLVSLAIVAGGLWMRRRQFSVRDQRQVVQWMGVGIGMLFLAAVLSLERQGLEGASTTDPLFFVLHMTSLGALGGVFTGIYDTRKRQHYRQQREIADQLETVVEATPIALVSLTFDGTVRIWNSAASDLFGWTSEEVVGEQYPLVTGPDEQGYREYLARLEAGDVVEGVETKRQHKDGRLIDVQVWAAPLEDADGEPTATIAAFVDVGEREHLQQEIRVLRRLFRHDLRNDLSVVSGYAGDIAENAEDERIRREARRVQQTGATLATLTDRVKNLDTRSETVGVVDVYDRLATICTEYRERYPDATITLDGPTDVRVLAVDGIDEALAEAVENAVVHADSGNPSVGVTIESPAPNETFTSIRVRDDGPGIPPGEIDAVRNGEESSLQHASGTGLWIVRWLVSKSGGDVEWASSDTGTTVTIALPTADES